MIGIGIVQGIFSFSMLNGTCGCTTVIFSLQLGWGGLTQEKVGKGVPFPRVHEQPFDGKERGEEKEMLDEDMSDIPEELRYQSHSYEILELLQSKPRPHGILEL